MRKIAASNHRRQRGFTLAELLLAAAILAFALTGLLLLFSNSILLNAANRNTAIATSHAQYLMEEIKNTTFSSIKSTYDGVCWDSTSISSKGMTPLLNEQVCAAVTGTNLLDVGITVSWIDWVTKSRTITLETLIVEP